MSHIVSCRPVGTPPDGVDKNKVIDVRSFLCIINVVLSSKYKDVLLLSYSYCIRGSVSSLSHDKGKVRPPSVLLDSYFQYQVVGSLVIFLFSNVSC